MEYPDPGPEGPDPNGADPWGMLSFMKHNLIMKLKDIFIVNILELEFLCVVVGYRRGV